jgi:nitrite reductase/ring-hydroxylating ferredoxin subunit
MNAKWERLCQAVEIPPGTRKRLPLGAIEILLINAGKRFYACACECPHEGGELEKADLQGHILRCCRHGYKMDLATGKCLDDAELEMPIFPVEVREGWVCVKA